MKMIITYLIFAIEIVIIVNCYSLASLQKCYQIASPPIYHPTGPELESCLPSKLPPPSQCPPLLDSIDQIDPRITMSTPELIVLAEYPVETHHVTTQGGYILTLFRIPHGKTDELTNPSANKSVVVLMHGLFCSSSDWLMQRDSNALPYLLADAGYDVWLGNARGCKYSLGHTTLRSYESNSPYWDFSWHEMGVYDVPALINHILKKSGQPNLYWIGHSMGNTMLHVTLSMIPEYNAKIRTLFALAPVTNNTNGNNVLFTIFGTPEIYQRNYETFGEKEFFPKPIQDFTHYLGILCEPLAQILCIPLGFCNHIPFLVFGYDCPQVDSQMIPIILGHTPSNESARTLAHYLQLHWGNRFSPFDFSYGITPGKTNMGEYGAEFPPLYNLTKITAPVVYMSSYADNFSPPEDVCYAAKKVPGIKELILNVGGPTFKYTHGDFLYAKDAKTFVYDPLMTRMKPTPSENNEFIRPIKLPC